MDKQAVSSTMMPQIETQIENIISYLGTKIIHLEKAIDYHKDVFRQLDEVANKLNPDAFHKNQPQCESAENGQSTKMGEPADYRSGFIGKLHNAVQELEKLTKKLDEFTADETRNTVNFFKNQI